MADESVQELVAAKPLAARSAGGIGRSERAVVRAAQAGSADAAEELARMHWHMAHQAAFLITRDAAAAEDIAQEAILAALGSLERFDRRRPFRPWLHRIVANRSIDWLRARDRRREVELVEVPIMSDDRDSVAMAIESLARLDPQTRAIVVLRCLLDYRAGEIALMVDLTPGAVRTRLHRGLAELRQALDEEER